MLTQDQVERYRREGYIVLEGVIAAETLAELRRVTDEFVATARGVTGHTKVLDLDPSYTPERPRVRRIESPHLHHPFYWGPDIRRSCPCSSLSSAPTSGCAREAR